MKPKYVKLISALICIAIVFTVTALTRTEISGAGSNTVLFYNDKAWTLSNRLPPEQVHSVYYVPISYLVQLPNVDVRMNEALKTFVITHGELYLSFDISTDFAANQNKERMYIKTAEYHSERYVPVRTVCAYLELGYEEIVNSTTGAVAIRVTDGNQQSSLGELVKAKYPMLFPDAADTSADTSDTGSSTTPPPDSEPIPLLSDRIIYITIEQTTGSHTDSILSVLKHYGYTATFFVSPESVKSSAAMLSKISAGGHEIALCLKGDGDTLPMATDALVDIEAQNELLSRLIKRKSRILSLSDTKAGSEELTALADELGNSGYAIWASDVNLASNFRSSTAATTAINGIRLSKTVSLRFVESRYTAEALRLVFDFITTNSSACEVRTVSLAFCESTAK